MKQLRRLELVLVVMMLMLVHITLPAYADATNNVVHVAPLAYVDATDAAENFANSLLQFFGY